MDASVLLSRLETSQNAAANIALLKGAVNRQSITGNEANFVGFLTEEMHRRNLAPEIAEFLPARPNLWGERKGAGGGPRLLFIGHTDTVHVDGWKENWAGTERENPFAASEVDGALWGRGVADLKGGICASLAALDLLDDLGVRLKGDVAYAFIGDEESGEEGSGVSAGVADWTDRVQSGEIAKPDFAVYVEPTQLSVYTSQIGFFIAEVIVTGKSAYFGCPELGIDALTAAHSILSSIWAFATQLELLTPHPLVGQSSILVTGVTAGGSIAVPGECKISVIGKLRPGDTLETVTKGFEQAVSSAPVQQGIETVINYTAGRDHKLGGSAVEISPELAPVRQLQRAIKQVLPDKGQIDGAPYWAESPFLINGLDCPTVYCAAGDISVCHTVNEHLNVQEYLAAVRAFALFITQYCGIYESTDSSQTES